jgi:hypothetical protein
LSWSCYWAHSYSAPTVGPFNQIAKKQGALEQTLSKPNICGSVCAVPCVDDGDPEQCRALIMWSWVRRQSRRWRARNYLRAYPKDVPAVQHILQALDTFGPDVVTNARQVAEMTAGRGLANAEWGWMGYRWERAWSAIVRLNATPSETGATDPTLDARARPVTSVPTVIFRRSSWWPWRRAG